MDATQNCYDFCSLLAKPIEFMANVLKDTGAVKSEYREKFVSLVRLKLNEVIKTEVVRYVGFLDGSLEKVDGEVQRQQQQQQQVSYDSRRPEEFTKPTEEEQRQAYFSFKETCKRLRNLVFIK